MVKGDDIQERLVNFAVNSIKLCAKLPKNLEGKHIANQLLRSGTSPAPNYGEARGAESRADFIHKLKIAHKEALETEYWLELTKASNHYPNPPVRIDKLLLSIKKLLNSIIKSSKK